MEKINHIATRREFLRRLGRYAGLGLLALFGGALWFRGRCRPGGAACAGCPTRATCGKPAALSERRTVWQLDPAKCIQCGRCATNCVLNPSAVKCVHSFSMCGYCKLCFGFFQPNASELTSAAENQVCPTDAIVRKFIEDPYFEYTIDEAKCIGCGKCVKGCTAFGNGSLYLQVRHDLCVNCNECAIARRCPAQAFRRVPADQPYLLKAQPASRPPAPPT